MNDSAATVSAPTRSREGLWYGLAAYGWWGLVPLYFKALDGVDPFEILAHRIVWSMLFLGILLSVARRWGLVRKCLTSGPLLRLFLSTALLIALNWYFYIYSVATEQMVQSSLGYFMTPLVSVALGMLFLGERLRRLQAVALGLAGAGVVIFALASGEAPGIALVLAGSFGLYGLLRKQAGVDGLVGLSVETMVLLPAALAFLLWEGGRGQLIFGRGYWHWDVLLLCSGVVTAVPLMCFAQAAQRLPLSTLGFLQYLSPCIQFLLAVLAFHESFPPEKAVAFTCIWLALAVFSLDAVRSYRAQPVVPLD